MYSFLDFCFVRQSCVNIFVKIQRWYLCTYVLMYPVLLFIWAFVAGLQCICVFNHNRFFQIVLQKGCNSSDFNKSGGGDFSLHLQQSWVKSLYFCYSLSEKVLSHYLNLHLHCIVWVSFMFILLGIWIGHAVISYSWPFPIFKIGFVFPCHFLWIPCSLQVQVLFHLHCPKLEDASFIHCRILIYIFC